MKNLFSNIVLIDDSTSYSNGQRVIYNHEIYLSKINNNDKLPSTGNIYVDNILKVEYTKTISLTAWVKI